MADYKLRTGKDYTKRHLSHRGARKSLCGKVKDYDVECSISLKEFKEINWICKDCLAIAEKETKLYMNSQSDPMAFM